MTILSEHQISTKQPRDIYQQPVAFFAFGLGSGLAPVSPGTWGSLAALLPYALLMQLSPLWYLLVCALVFLIGCWSAAQTADRLGCHDHGAIVIDEWVGMWLTLFLVPFSWSNVLVGFALFRLFDILKPWPIRWLDRHAKGGFGIMIDDVLAGFAAWGCLMLLQPVLSP